MYSFTPSQMKYISTNMDFWEVFSPQAQGRAVAARRRRLWEKDDYTVISFEDEGVSVGFYVMMKDGVRTYGENMRDRLKAAMPVSHCS